MTNNIIVAISNEYITIMKFYSPMCGGCLEIAPEFEDAITIYDMMGIKTMAINIDNNTEMEFAAAIGVLDEGLPNIRIFMQQGHNGISIVKGDSSVKSPELVKRVNEQIAKLVKNEQGFLLKGKQEL